MDHKERLALVQIALGKVSVDFMRQSSDVVMPTEALLETACQIEAAWAEEVQAAIAERDAEIERLREDVHHHSSTRAVLEKHLSRVDSGTPTLAEVAMHLYSRWVTSSTLLTAWETCAVHAIGAAEVLLAELDRRGK